jgi:hypothetical protein
MLFYVRTFPDGLSIPFFSMGRYILTMSCSRRDTPQADKELALSSSEDTSVVVAEGSWQGGIALPSLSDLPDSTHEDIETPKRIDVKFNELSTHYPRISPCWLSLHSKVSQN